MMSKSGIALFLSGVNFWIFFAPVAGANDNHHDSQGAAVGAGVSTHATTQASDTSVAADEAIRMLADGNARYVAQSQTRPNQDAERRHVTYSNGQHPYAAVLSCADSRAPVELIFDAGIGDLFVVRVAGNVASVDEIGTLEYGVEHLGINTILVMGHTKCGAVTAVVDHAHVTPNIEKLVEPIVPAADAARKTYPQLSGGKLVEKAIRINVNQSIANLTARSELIRERANAGTLKIVGAVYDLNSGELDWLEPSANPAVTSAHSDARPVSSRPSIAPVRDAKPDTHVHASKPTEASAHVDEHAAASTQPAAAAEKPRRENFVALGGLLAGSSLASCGVIFFLRART